MNLLAEFTGAWYVFTLEEQMILALWIIGGFLAVFRKRE